MNYVALGRQAEERATQYLMANGYFILARNFKFKKMGEIDIVARHNETLVFIEVKYRTNRTFGPPEDSLTERKVELIRRLAHIWMHINKYRNVPVRFDVIAMEQRLGSEQMRHYKNAF